jgi:hypothetical protein
MPYVVASILRANEVFSRLDGFEGRALLPEFADASTVLEGAEQLGLFEVLGDDDAVVLRDFLATMPASMDAAILAGLRSALERGVRAQFTWQPGYDFELRIWERSEGSEGVVNFHVLSPEPPETPRG